MADRIIVSPQELEACKSRYLNALGTLQESVAKYEKSLLDLGTDYTGKAFAIMSAKVANMGVNLKRSFDKLHDAVDELSAVGETFENEEKTTSTAANSLDSGTESPFRE